MYGHLDTAPPLTGLAATVLILVGMAASPLPIAAGDARGRRELLDHRFEIQPLDHGVYYGSAPKTAADYQRLRALGIRHVIDIRTFKVIAGAIETHRAERFGLKYERIPIGFFPTRRDTVPKLMQRLAVKPCGPIFFHCNLGSDRTGLLVALYRVRYLGWNPDHAFTVWKADQFNSRLKDLDRYYWSAVGRYHDECDYSAGRMSSM